MNCSSQANHKMGCRGKDNWNLKVWLLVLINPRPIGPEQATTEHREVPKTDLQPLLPHMPELKELRSQRSLASLLSPHSTTWNLLEPEESENLTFQLSALGQSLSISFISYFLLFKFHPCMSMFLVVFLVSFVDCAVRF